MDWLMRSGTFVCLRQDCPKDVAPNHSCSRCMMPWVDKGTKAVIQLYQRCRDRRVLPLPGGLFNQPETLMTAFDHIDAVIAAYRKQESDESEQKMKRDDALRRLQSGRH